MKVKQLLKTLSQLSLFLVLLDCVAPLPSALLLPNFYTPIKKEKTPVEDFKRDKDLGALEYLVLAHSRTNRTLTEENNCKGFAIETFRNYKILIEEDKRQDLSGDVRLAFGNVDADYPALHAWAEIKIEGKWEPFETTNWETRVLNNLDLKRQTEDRKNHLTPDSMSNYIPIALRQADQSVSRINPEWFYKSKGLLIPAAYTTADWIDIWIQDRKISEE